MENAVSGAAALIERCGGPHAVLGFSMGAAVAVRLALKRPDLVKGLVLCSGSADRTFWSGGDGLLRRVLEEPWPKWYELLIQAVLPLSVSRRFGSALNFGRLAQKVDQGSRMSYERQREALKNGSSLLDELPGITIPALVCAGQYDELIPAEEGRKIASALPGGDFRLFSAGHSIMYDCPGELARSVADFLGDIKEVRRRRETGTVPSAPPVPETE